MSSLRKYLPLLATLAAGVSMGLPAVALAGAVSPTAGVHIDPSSPVAKEYALPLATARGAPADTGSTGALFGRGITKPHGGRSTDGNSDKAPQADSATSPAADTTSPAADTTTPAADTTTPETGNATPETNSAVSTDTAPAASRTPEKAPIHRRGRLHHRHGTGSGASTQRIHQGVPAGSPHTAARSRTTTLAAARILHAGSGSSWLWMLIVALAVLAVGSAGALLLVRIAQRDPKPD